MSFFGNIKKEKKRRDTRLTGIMGELKSIRGGQKNKAMVSPKKKKMMK